VKKSAHEALIQARTNGSWKEQQLPLRTKFAVISYRVYLCTGGAACVAPPSDGGTLLPSGRKLYIANLCARSRFFAYSRTQFTS
jgi:hypothetical protein